MVGLFDRFKKKEEEEDYGGEMVEERPSTEYESEPEPETEEVTSEPEPAKEPEPEPQIETPQTAPQTSMGTSSEIGIDNLMDKRVKLDEAIDYVGLMIKIIKKEKGPKPQK